MGEYKAQKKWKLAIKKVKSNRIEEGFRDYQKLYNTLSYSPYFMYNYGSELSLAKRYKKSIEIRRKTEGKLNDADFYIYLGNSYSGVNDFDKAIESFKKASYIMPIKFYPKYRLVYLFHQTGRTREAYELAKKLLEMPVKVESPAIDQMLNEMRVFVNQQSENHQPY